MREYEANLGLVVVHLLEPTWDSVKNNSTIKYIEKQQVGSWSNSRQTPTFSFVCFSKRPIMKFLLGYICTSGIEVVIKKKKKKKNVV